VSTCNKGKKGLKMKYTQTTTAENIKVKYTFVETKKNECN